MNRIATMVFLGLCAVGEPALGEALSTTSGGMGVRNLTYTQAKKSALTEDDPTGKDETTNETLHDPILCQRISTPSSLGVELGAGGCVHGGGYRSFAHSISSHVQLIYYPLASRARIDNDDSVRVNRTIFGDLYLVGQGGFAKITHSETEETAVTLSTDVIEFGGGIGWSYRFSEKISAGVEGYYLVGSILSRATTGSTNMMLASALVTVFL